MQEFNKPLNIEKTNQINSQAINENAESLNVTNYDIKKNINITSNKNKQSPKKNIKKRKKVVSIDIKQNNKNVQQTSLLCTSKKQIFLEKYYKYKPLKT